MPPSRRNVQHLPWRQHEVQKLETAESWMIWIVPILPCISDEVHSTIVRQECLCPLRLDAVRGREGGVESDVLVPLDLTEEVVMGVVVEGGDCTSWANPGVDAGQAAPLTLTLTLALALALTLALALVLILALILAPFTAIGSSTSGEAAVVRDDEISLEARDLIK